MKSSVDRRYPDKPFMAWQRKRKLQAQLAASSGIKSKSKEEKARKVAIADEALKELNLK